MAALNTEPLHMVLPPAPWTRAMEDGRVRVEGLAWTCNAEIGNAPDRFIATASQECDVGENGVRRLALAIIDGAPPTGLPVFFGREHMQRNFIVRADSSMTSPRDLAGRRVATRLSIESGTGAGVLMMLESAFGVDLRDIVWQTGSPGQPKVNRMGLRLEPGSLDETELFEELRQGKVDAVFATTGPRYWSMFGGEGDHLDPLIRPFPDLRPLMHDPTQIAETYRRTHLCPITDVVVVKPQLATGESPIPARVVEALVQANALASSYRGAAEQQLAVREVELLGEDPHQYGLGTDQRANLATLLDLFYRLGSIARPVEPEELFVPSVARPL